MNIIKSSILLVPLAFFSCKSQTDSSLRLEKSEQQLTELRSASMKNKKNPRSINPDGSVRWIEPSYDWTEGFFPGTCWMQYQLTNDEKWKEAAISIQELYKSHKDLTTDHDLGFIFYNSYGKAYQITGEEQYRQVIIDASNALITRFNKNVGCLQSWDVVGNWQAERGWKFPVIIDNLMNLEMLFEVSKITKDDKYKKIAIQHANTTMKNHFRPDGSSYHVVDYNPETGEIAHRITAQGYADESAWARGQSWALYGYTMCYRYTKDKKYLDFAEKIARFILNHPNYPKDGVPYWDYNAPKIPNEPRDASAAAIMASALIELSGYTNGRYINNAQHILNSLATDTYTAQKGQNGNFVLMHSVGSIPHGNEIDVPLNYADYYYIEALSRLQNQEL
ncbi:glycosyl hydrolase family 88 [Pseudopedobacter saltans DSM 12145]|uniref:Glycosyl hydrolase family 88 n=1 Tax=Pseudopedobacter saltans (strain ATCC 51119 / DSM 12145 / JCM 21818 / CCUG 39354 / LMG 10337 / NBRC 100064 / NCIMB 13643) TaxID=762903 RepID=F0SEX2_PSESL|nr:glycoside hydrolase family 88 protein [Pseudopedobacter saltans]ADY53038.1 glycosyl hydrolase family 88 [Pseudopedobacter saltans DSM 12145]